MCIKGEDWSEVEPPQKDLRLIQVSVGTDAVWAITHDGGVWFRKGIQGEISGVCEQLAIGTGWVEMLSKMALISIAPNDQVTILINFLLTLRESLKKIENFIYRMCALLSLILLCLCHKGMGYRL